MIHSVFFYRYFLLAQALLVVVLLSLVQIAQARDESMKIRPVYPTYLSVQNLTEQYSVREKRRIPFLVIPTAQRNIPIALRRAKADLVSAAPAEIGDCST
ncbi:hypothetical protein MNBD_PLANCTO02-1662 [hydrothermal vent metagenome]|uniref:Uncharacterized protein n=1 Tax=hydrothermal vent metagenome TaxID=652676 RepID=A0A3B1DJ89_9ZZZZ